MNSDELESPGKRKINAALKDNIDRFTNGSRKLTIYSEVICKCNKKSTRRELLNLLNYALKVL